MRYIANPVEVEAWQITDVGPIAADGTRVCFSGNRDVFHVATTEQMARMTPNVGDYVVKQSDGYIYLNPKDVFERKYRPAELNALELGAAVRRAGLSGS